MTDHSAGPRGAIDYAGLVERLRQDACRLVPEWLPAGEERGGRWYVGDFDGSPGDSANVNLATGQWIDNGGGDGDSGHDLLKLYARITGKRNSEAALELIERYRWERDYLREAPQSRGPAMRTPAPGGPMGEDPPPEDPHAPPSRPPTPSAATGRSDRWRSVLPVPNHAPAPKHFRFSMVIDKSTGQRQELEAVKVWPYVFEGERLGYVARFERVNSKGVLVKDTLPMTWCEDTEDPRHGQRWHWKQWAAPRPLYVPATVLSGTPADVPVVLVEGEKCAEAGHQLLGHEFDFVSWPGGCKAWALARWSILMGRTVYMWPDADAQRAKLTPAEREAGVDPESKPIKPLTKQPGYMAMCGIGQVLQVEQGCTVYIKDMPAPGKLPDGWDLADAIAQGWTAADVRAHIRGFVPFRGPDAASSAAVGNGGGGASTPPPAAAGPGDDEPSRDWRAHLLCAKNGAVQGVRENVVTAIDGWPAKGVPGIDDTADLIRFNQFSNNIEKTRPTPWGTPAGDWLEADELQMGDWLVREHYMPSCSRQVLEEAVIIVARRHAYHPLRERVEGLRGKWDKIPRADTWLQRVCLEEDEHDADLQTYLALAGKWFLMGMCARVMSEVRQGSEVKVGPGCKFDYMLVLEGLQAAGKSTFAKVLGGDYFADTGLDITHKDSLMNIQGVWVYEWSELESLTKSEVGAVKRFISSDNDRFRATFDRRPAKYPRQVVFIGTTNEAQYLMDTTGNRRFWPVRTTRDLDIAWLRENVDQLLAEAVDAVDRGERFYPTREEQRRYFDPQQRERTLESSLESAIRTYLYDEQQKVPHGLENGVMVREIGLQALLTRIGYGIDKQNDAIAKKAGQIMHALGWTVRRLSGDDEGRRPRVYVRPAETTQRRNTGPQASASHPFNGPMQGPSLDAEDAPPF